MKFISITKSINIRPDWATIGARLKAGTPLDITGAVANSSAAVGILADDAEKSSAEVAVVTEGSIDLAEITASYGELEDDCIAAIKGISFIGFDGSPIVPSGGGLPDYSEASDGDVLSIDDGEPAWVTPSGGGGTLDFDTYAVKLAPTSTTNQFDITLYNLKSGEACGTSVASIETDGETGDYRIVLGDTTGWDAPAVLIYELRYRFDRFDVDSLEADYTAGRTFGFYV